MGDCIDQSSFYYYGRHLFTNFDYLNCNHRFDYSHFVNFKNQNFNHRIYRRGSLDYYKLSMDHN